MEEKKSIYRLKENSEWKNVKMNNIFIFNNK
jgi:hypothetical protein